MDMKELAEWMKKHDIANKLKDYIHNAYVNGENYTAIEDLATSGKANVTISLVQGAIRIAKTETFEGDFESAKVELVEAKKTVKVQEKAVKSLEKEVESLKEEQTVVLNTDTDTIPDLTTDDFQPTVDINSKLQPKKVKK